MAVSTTISNDIATHRGDAADDTIRALIGPPGATSNHVFGGGGDDLITSNFTDDRLFGGTGNDTITDRSGSDFLSGAAGRDHLTGVGSGEGDTLKGGSGSDELDYTLQSLPSAAPGVTALNGGAGKDLLRFEAGISVAQALYFDQEDGDWGYVDAGKSEVSLGSLSSLERFAFDGDMDTIFEGSSKSETVIARSGKDSLYGAAGHDFLAGGGDADRLFGGNGDDLLLGDGVASFGNGNSSLFDVLNGGRGDDVLVGTSGPARLSGGGGDDVLIGLGAGGKMTGGSGDDAFFFRAPQSGEPLPDDLLARSTAGFFETTVSDSRLPRDFADLVVNGGKGTDTVYFDGLERENAGSANPGVQVDLAKKEAVLDPRGGGATFKLVKVEGVVGTAHDDTISGRRGAQTIEGGEGDDLLTGKGGADLFIFGKTWGHDTITDFDADGAQGDILDLVGAGLRFRDLKITDVTRDGVDGTLVKASGKASVFLQEVDRGEVTADMFDF